MVGRSIYLLMGSDFSLRRGIGVLPESASTIVQHSYPAPMANESAWAALDMPKVVRELGIASINANCRPVAAVGALEDLGHPNRGRN